MREEQYRFVLSTYMVRRGYHQQLITVRACRS